MLPVPGTLNADGTVNHTAVATFTGTAMLVDSDDKESAWKFMQWWISSKTQNAFGKRLESVVGTYARYNTANKTAMTQIKWDPDMKDSLLYQAERLRAFPEVPGGYFTSRLYDFCFRKYYMMMKKYERLSTVW